MKDFFVWSQSQATALKDRDAGALDWDGLAEEIEDMGKRDRRELVSFLAVKMVHLLKWNYQPALRNRGWILSATNASIAVEAILKDSPSLRSAIPALLPEAYRQAVKTALAETGLTKVFPKVCPWDFKEVMANLKEAK